MVELWIDDQRCDIEKIPTLPIEFESERLTKVEGYRTGRTIVLELPATPRNDAIFGSSRDLYATSRFNTDHHRATLKCNNIVIFEGTAYLVATTVKASFEGSYKIRIAEGGAEWIERVAKGLVSNLDIPFAERLDLSTISKSWEGDQAVRFLPVHRGEREPRYTDTVGVVVERVMLTDDYHPTQIFADLLTVRETFGSLDANTCIAYVGDGRNNVANSLMMGCAKSGVRYVCCCPDELRPDEKVLAEAEEVAKRNGVDIRVFSDPKAGVKGANVLYTDVWVSMGEEAKTAKRIALLRPYQINMDLMRATGNLDGKLMFLHCLPAFHDFETEVTKDCGALEVTDEVFESKYSKVFDESENRMHTIKALLVSALCDRASL